MDKIQYIFCSKCGNKIKSDSIYCKYCGTKIADEEQLEEAVVDNVETLHENDINKNNTKEDETIKVKLIGHHTEKKAIVANEIVANIKMIGFAILLWIVYILCFIVYHLKDSAPITERDSYFGESCYDPVMVRIPHSYELDWEKCLYNKIWEIDSNVKENLLYIMKLDLDHQISTLEKTREIAEIRGIKEEQFEQYKQDAIEEAKRNRDSYNEYLSDIRQSAYKEDLHKNMRLAAVFSLCLMIIGRYFILACKWVRRNRT